MARHARKAPLLALIILDGWGHRAETRDNGIALARKPFFDALLRDHPHTLIDGSGPAVGLPEGVMGNSEVGHMNLGAGRIVYSGLSQIYRTIADGSFFSNPALLSAVKGARANVSTLHLMGLLSDGAVHSHRDHLYALLELAKRAGLQDVAVHAFLDGRDTPPDSGVKHLEALRDKMKAIGIGRFASVMGRFFAMDRDKRWDRVAKAFRAMCGRGEKTTADPLAYVRDSYAQGIGDEFVEPATVAAAIRGQDTVIFFNFRADRAREISHAIVDHDFPQFDRGGFKPPGVFVAMAPYEESLKVPIAFTPEYPENTLPDVIARNGIRQLRVAETEKYAHVTFFFNGGRELTHPFEDRALIPSPREVPTYDKKPVMSARGVRDEFLRRLETGDYGLIVCNFANADMVGHTAVPEAIVSAVETVDECLSAIVPAVIKRGGTAIVTADHGNAEEMKDARGEPMTAHTTNLVPFILVSPSRKGKPPAVLRPGGRLCDVAPTILELMGLPQPAEMTGRSLLVAQALRTRPA